MAVTINGTTGIVTPDIGVDGSTLVVDSVNNRIGIGISSPGTPLDVAGIIQSDTGLQVAGHPVVGYATITGGYAARLGSTGSTTLNKTQIYARGANVATFDGATGNVGIGTDSPGERLQLTTTSGNCKLRIDAASAASVDFYNSGTRFSDMFTDASTGNFTITNRQDADIILRTNGTNERLRITSGGGVKYISADSPTSTTEPAQILNHSGGWQFYASSGSSTHRNIIFCSANNAASERLRINSSGFVGINETAPEGRFHVLENTGDGSSRTLAMFQKNHASTSLSGNMASNGYPHALILENQDTSSDQGLSSLCFSKYTSGSQSQAVIAGISESAGNMALTFNTESSNTIGERLRITSGGNIGINQSTPTSQSGKVLHISGDHGGQARIHLSTSASGHGADEGHYIVSQGAESGAVAGQLAIINCENRNIAFNTGSVGANATRVTVQHDGNLNIADGNLIVANGHGIDFTATANGGTGTPSELFDDYEEGTFTPTIRGSVTAGTATGTIAGRYIKIGHFVHASIRVNNVNFSGSGGAIRIDGLPYAIRSASYSEYSSASVSMIYNITYDTNYKHGWYVNPGSTSMYGIQSRSGQVWQDWASSNFHSSSIYLNQTITYMAA